MLKRQSNYHSSNFIYCIDERTCYTGGTGEIGITIDGGESWHFYLSKGSQQTFSVTCLPATTKDNLCFGVGGRGQILAGAPLGSTLSKP